MPRLANGLFGFTLIAFILLLTVQVAQTGPSVWPTNQQNYQRTGLFPFRVNAWVRPTPLLDFDPSMGDPPGAGHSWVTSYDNQYSYSAFIQTWVYQQEQNLTLSQIAAVPSDTGYTFFVTALGPFNNYVYRTASTFAYKETDQVQYLVIANFYSDTQYMNNTCQSDGPITTAPIEIQSSDGTKSLIVAGATNSYVYSRSTQTSSESLNPTSCGSGSIGISGLVADSNSNIYMANSTHVTKVDINLQVLTTSTLGYSLCAQGALCFMMVDQNANLLYIASKGNLNVVAYTLDTLQFSYNVTLLASPTQAGAIYSPPGQTTSILVFPTSQGLIAIQGQEIIWATLGDTALYVSNIVIDFQGNVYHADSSGTIFCNNVTSGQKIWYTQPYTLPPNPKPTIAIGPFGDLIVSFGESTFFFTELRPQPSTYRYYIINGTSDLTVTYQLYGSPSQEQDFVDWNCIVYDQNGNQNTSDLTDTFFCNVPASFLTSEKLQVNYVLAYSSGYPTVVENQLDALIGVGVSQVDPSELYYEDTSDTDFTITGVGFTVCQDYSGCECSFETSDGKTFQTDAAFQDPNTLSCASPVFDDEQNVVFTLLIPSSTGTTIPATNQFPISFTKSPGKSKTWLIVLLVILGIVIVVGIAVVAFFAWRRRRRSSVYTPLRA